MHRTHRVLVVAGSDDARAALLSALRTRGHEAEPLTDLAALQRAHWPWPPDVLLLDADLPALPGRPPPDALVLLRGLRLHCSLPVIVLGCGDDPVDRVLALESGADDCLAKPWLMRELTARIDAVLRRARTGLPGPAQGQPGALWAGAWRLDPLTRRLCRRDGPEVALTEAEFRLMRAFFERPRRVLARADLLALDQPHGADTVAAGAAADTQAAAGRGIDLLVSRLRGKLGDDPRAPRWLHTVRGRGYRFELGEPS